MRDQEIFENTTFFREESRNFPLFIGARENKIVEKIEWKVRMVCLLHGERFRWKKRCSSCRYLIKFEEKVTEHPLTVTILPQAR